MRIAVLGLVMLTCGLLAAPAEAADFKSHFNAFSRFFGFGWSDGYHAPARHGGPASSPLAAPPVAPEATWQLPPLTPTH